MTATRSLNEVRYGMKTEGIKVKLPHVEGASITVVAVSFFESEFAPGACVQFLQGEGKGWFLTHSEFVIEILRQMKDHLPFETTPTSNKSASDRTYWTLE